jgi:hypothetical protein
VLVELDELDEVVVDPPEPPVLLDDEVVPVPPLPPALLDELLDDDALDVVVDELWDPPAPPVPGVPPSSPMRSWQPPPRPTRSGSASRVLRDRDDIRSSR